MAWPSTNPASGPIDFGGPGATVPTSSTEIGGAAALWLLGLTFINTAAEAGGVTRVVTVTNTAGAIIWKNAIPPGSTSNPYSPTFEPITGLKWFVDAGSDVVGHAWGYQ